MTPPVDEHAIAIVGMAGRFPGARDLDELWRNLRDGVESVTFFSVEELAALGVDPRSLRDPDFVRAAPVLADADLFDAGFFGYSPREAALLDPQHRIFLECAWEALENAGYRADAIEGLTGVYAGMSLSSYLLYNLLGSSQVQLGEDGFQLMIGTDKDFLATRTSYHLDLKGPSLDVQTGCSTSLVAAYLACEGLLSFQCDLALAGGISIQVPRRWGYRYEKEGITSPDGHCRAFDADARGTLFGSGVGIVVLKRLADALADGDRIAAIIKGAAVNNDGSVKVGFTAPGVDGQAEVIARAQAIAGVEPESITYVEAHGTGTPFGDPVEVAALTKAFATGTGRQGFCGLGSIKTNVGHLDAAAGVAGLIKTVLALQHRQIPPSLHFRTPNPRLELAASPFYVVDRLTPWTSPGPLRAGVSSFGIGGTNAHFILEEAPATARADARARTPQLLVLSARDPEGVEQASLRLAGHLETHPEADLADVAYTLQVGRKRFSHRRVALCLDSAEAVALLREWDRERVWDDAGESDARPVAFLFPGGGTQHPDMGRELYEREPIFRGELDGCAERLRRQLGYDILEPLFPSPEMAEAAARRMRQPSCALPILFSVEYALARLLMTWGVKPQAMIGHSLGEYAAACLAGVFSLDDALALVTLRGRLFEQLPEGGMLSLPLPEAEARAAIARFGRDLSIAAVNGPTQCVVSGTVAAIDELARSLEEDELEFRRIQIEVAAHSHLVDPILAPFRSFVERLELRPPAIPFLSNVTGIWATAAETTDPGYWVRQLRQTVRFGSGLRELLADDRALLEVGPGRALSTLAQMQTGPRSGRPIIASMRHPFDTKTDLAVLLGAVGRLWAAGVDVDWRAFHQGEPRRRVPLPTYPFARRRHWIEPATGAAFGAPRNSGKLGEIADWFHLPSWRRAPAAVPGAAEAGVDLLFVDRHGLAEGLAGWLASAGRRVLLAEPGPGFAPRGEDRYEIDPGRPEDYAALLSDLGSRSLSPDRVVHLWSLDGADVPAEPRDFHAVQARGFHSLLHLTRALGGEQPPGRLPLFVITDFLFAVESGDLQVAAKATLLGPCKVAPQEYPGLACRCLDVRLDPGGGAGSRLIEQLAAELAAADSEPAVALRGQHRWIPSFEPVRLIAGRPVRRLRERGVYLLTGGFGEIGRELARFLAREVRARLVLVGRTPLPPREEWAATLDRLPADDPLAVRLRGVREIEAAGGEVLALAADVGEPDQAQYAVDRAVQEFGSLDGVIHLAGRSGEGSVCLIDELDSRERDAQLAAKVQGAYALAGALGDRRLDFCLLFSSNAAILGGIGGAAYAAANLFLDAFAGARAESATTTWISANWDGWRLDRERLGRVQTSLDRFAMTTEESLEAFRRVVEQAPAGQVVVSTGDLQNRLRDWTETRPPAAAEPVPAPRSATAAPYAPSEDALQERIVAIWSELLGACDLGIDDNFFDLGGNSLIGLKMIQRLKRELGREIEMIKLFEGPTVRALAGLLRATEEPADSATTAEAAFTLSRDRGERRRERHRTPDGGGPG